jgi:hypothetical protein
VKHQVLHHADPFPGQNVNNFAIILFFISIFVVGFFGGADPLGSAEAEEKKVFFAIIEGSFVSFTCFSSLFLF